MPGQDVGGTLDDLERRLKELELELQESAPGPFFGLPGGADLLTLGPAPVAAAVPVEAPSPDAEPASPAARTADADVVREARSQLAVLRAELDELLDLREQLDELRAQLVAAAQELVGEHHRVLGHVVPLAPPGAPGAGTGLVEPVLQGALTVDAGPFADLLALAAFGDALSAVPGVTGVDLRSFHGDHAHLHLHLDRAVALGTELRATSGRPYVVRSPAPGAVTITAGPDA